MVYLDYSATTPADDGVVNSFNKVLEEYIGNPNSLHKLGFDSNDLIEQATSSIRKILSLSDKEMIYTSSASESINLAIKGIALKYSNRGKHIITTPIEHSSVIGTVGYLQSIGYEVDFVNVDSNGLIDINHLESLLRDDTILVSIVHVSSEVGIIQDVDKVIEVLKDYNKCFLHVDASQSMGKIEYDYNKVDLVSFSGHKIYGLNGVAGLIKDSKISLVPLIHGGKSTTVYRSGTASVALIVSLAKALRLVHENLDEKTTYIKSLNQSIVKRLSQYNNVVINSNEYCLKNIINFSIKGVKPETFMHALEEHDIYISTKSACASNNPISKEVMALTNDSDLASSSLRISLSHLTKLSEIEYFLDKFDELVMKYAGEYENN